MKWKLAALAIIFSIFFLPIPQVRAFEHIDNINNGISVYFLISLNENENIEVNITHLGSGDFTLFLFDTRPVDSFINFDNSLNPEIFDHAINYSLDDNPYINYTVLDSRIYYIQIILLENGPDTFFLFCNYDLTRYYLPSVPGYDTVLLCIAFVLALPIILVSIKKKLKS